MMPKGLQGKQAYTDLLTADEKRITERLAQIEQEDANRCASCGGEDCVCCEYYHDRQKWTEPDELFGW